MASASTDSAPPGAMTKSLGGGDVKKWACAFSITGGGGHEGLSVKTERTAQGSKGECNECPRTNKVGGPRLWSGSSMVFPDSYREHKAKVRNNQVFSLELDDHSRRSSHCTP